MRNKVTAVLLILVLACSTLTFAFPDTEGHWAESYANRLNSLGILLGDEAGNANLEGIVKRSEFISMLVRALYGADSIPSGTRVFDDVEPGAWYFDAVSHAYLEGIIQGSGNNLFSPDSPIKREASVLKLVRSLELTGGSAEFTDLPADYPYKLEIAAAAESGIITGYPDGSFRPSGSATRGEAAAVLCRMLDVINGDPIQTPSPLVSRINLTWHQVYSTGITSAGSAMNGLDVLSPTWFSIVDNTGKTPASYEYQLDGNLYLQDLGNSSYMEDAKQKGYQVWVLFKTDFSAEANHTFLSNAAARAKAVSVIESLIQSYGLNGINLDFENMYVTDKDAYTSFVKEMADMCHRVGVPLSVDVTKYEPTGGNWSMCYDRAAIAQYADYVALMAYDEYGTFSSTAGSVSSIPWAEGAIQKTLEEVPAEKLLLGIPFYTRLWQSQNGRVVKTSAIGMETAQKTIAEAGASIQYDSSTGQNYATWQKDGYTYEIWLEDETSIKARLDFVAKYNLAGIASWSNTFATQSTWDFIEENLK